MVHGQRNIKLIRESFEIWRKFLPFRHAMNLI